jgi:hypothetical protein
MFQKGQETSNRACTASAGRHRCVAERGRVARAKSKDANKIMSRRQQKQSKDEQNWNEL